MRIQLSDGPLAGQVRDVDPKWLETGIVLFAEQPKVKITPHLGELPCRLTFKAHDYRVVRLSGNRFTLSYAG